MSVADSVLMDNQPSVSYAPEDTGTTRRSFVSGLAALSTFDFGLDEDGDGKILDDLLGLDEDRLGSHIPTFLARDAQDADRIDPPSTSYPIRVIVLSGPHEGIHIIMEAQD